MKKSQNQKEFVLNTRKHPFLAAISRSHLGFAALMIAVVGFNGILGCKQDNIQKDVGPSENDKTESSADAFFTDAKVNGFEFSHQVGDLNKYHFPDIMAGGCGVIDFDNDGLMDLILVNSGNIEDEFNSTEVTKRQNSKNRLFRQTACGDFRDVTDAMGIGDSGYGCGVGVADINNDGYDDIYFSNFGDDKLYLNQKGESFKDVTVEAGINNPSWGMSVTFLDFDLDGRLDLFVTNYVSYIAETNCANAGDAEDFCNPSVFDRTSDKLFRNVSQGNQIKFEDVTVKMGIAAKKGPGLGVISRDFNRDGYPDIYVANDGWENFLWINRKGESFSEEASQLGCAMSLKGDAQAGMGVAEGDLDFNQVSDIVVTHLDGETNAAYLGNLAKVRDKKQLFFTESGGAKGVQKISKPMTGFGIVLADVDNDGDLDMLTANGRVTRKRRVPSQDFWQDYSERNQISLNQGKGNYKEYSSNGDSFASDVAVSRGLAVVDINNDGRLDCLVLNAGDKAKLYTNVYNKSGNWIGFSVAEPDRGGRDSLGARVTLNLDKGTSLQRIVQTDGSYLSANDSRVHFGLGANERLGNVEVIWPDGKAELFYFDKINQYHEIKKGEGDSIE